MSLCCQQHYTSRSLFGSSSCVAKNDDAATITDYNYKVISLFVLYADFVHCSWKKNRWLVHCLCEFHDNLIMIYLTNGYTIRLTQDSWNLDPTVVDRYSEKNGEAFLRNLSFPNFTLCLPFLHNRTKLSLLQIGTQRLHRLVGYCSGIAAHGPHWYIAPSAIFQFPWQPSPIWLTIKGS